MLGRLAPSASQTPERVSTPGSLERVKWRNWAARAAARFKSAGELGKRWTTNMIRLAASSVVSQDPPSGGSTIQSAILNHLRRRPCAGNPLAVLAGGPAGLEAHLTDRESRRCSAVGLSREIEVMPIRARGHRGADKHAVTRLGARCQSTLKGAPRIITTASACVVNSKLESGRPHTGHRRVVWRIRRHRGGVRAFQEPC